MTPVEVSHAFGAHPVGDGQWRGKCPNHDGKSSNSLSIQATQDGKTLVRCWGGCPTDEVLNAAGLGWSDLFANSHPFPSQHRQVDPEIALRRKAEKTLREWKEKASRTIGYRLWLRHRLIAKGEKLVADGREERGLDLLELAYLELSRLTWLADLIDSKNSEDWKEARQFWG